MVELRHDTSVQHFFNDLSDAITECYIRKAAIIMRLVASQVDMGAAMNIMFIHS